MKSLNSFFNPTIPFFSKKNKTGFDFNIMLFFLSGKNKKHVIYSCKKDSLDSSHDDESLSHRSSCPSIGPDDDVTSPQLQGDLGISTPGFGSHCSTWPWKKKKKCGNGGSFLLCWNMIFVGILLLPGKTKRQEPKNW